MAIGIVLSVFGLGFFCWLLFTLAVYALPFFAGLTAGLAAFHSGSGVIGAIIVGVLAGGATLALGQIAFATVRTPLIRAIIGLLYAVPAAIAGYQRRSRLAGIGMPAGGWQQAFAIVGAFSLACTALCAHGAVCPAAGRAGLCGGPAHSPSTGGRTTRRGLIASPS